MKEDPFIALCNRLQLDFYKVAGTMHRCHDYHCLSKALDISLWDAKALWDAYWASYSEN